MIRFQITPTYVSFKYRVIMLMISAVDVRLKIMAPQIPGSIA
jgi:hypothetical protein